MLVSAQTPPGSTLEQTEAVATGLQKHFREHESQAVESSLDCRMGSAAAARTSR